MSWDALIYKGRFQDHRVTDVLFIFAYVVKAGKIQFQMDKEFSTFCNTVDKDLRSIVPGCIPIDLRCDVKSDSIKDKLIITLTCLEKEIILHGKDGLGKWITSLTLDYEPEATYEDCELEVRLTPIRRIISLLEGSGGEEF